MLWFFIIIVVLTLLLNKLTTKYGFKNLNYKRGLSGNVVEIGQEFQISTIVENGKPIPVTFLEITERFPDSFQYAFKTNSIHAGEYLNHTTTMFLLPYQRLKRTYSITGIERGVYKFRDVSLALGDFIGIDTKYKELESLQEIVVLPKPISLNEAIVPYGNYNGDISVKRWIIDDPLMTIGIREYTGREPEKHIHWSSSLKYGKLMVKNFDFTTDNTVVFILNVESSKPFWTEINSDMIEWSISICRGLMEKMEREKIPYGFTTNSQVSSFYNGENITPPGVGPNQLSYLTEMLGRISYSLSVTFEELLENLHKSSFVHTTYVIVTPKMFESYIEPIEKLSRRANKTVLISFEDKNLNKLSDSITKYVRRV